MRLSAFGFIKIREKLRLRTIKLEESIGSALTMQPAARVRATRGHARRTN